MRNDAKMIGLEIEALVVRSATNRDTDGIVSLVARCLSEFDLRPDFENAESDLIDIEATYIETGGFFKIVEDGCDEPIGTFGVYPVDQSSCKLRKMYVVPRARGRGLGSYMLTYAIDEARKIGFETMILETMTVMRDAIRLYTRTGFELKKKRPESPRCELVFSLSLTESRSTQCPIRLATKKS